MKYKEIIKNNRLIKYDDLKESVIDNYVKELPQNKKKKYNENQTILTEH